MLCGSPQGQPPAPTHSRGPGKWPQDGQLLRGVSLQSRRPTGQGMLVAHSTRASLPALRSRMASLVPRGPGPFRSMAPSTFRISLPKKAHSSSTESCTRTAQRKRKTKLLPAQPDSGHDTRGQLGSGGEDGVGKDSENSVMS